MAASVQRVSKGLLLLMLLLLVVLRLKLLTVEVGGVGHGRCGRSCCSRRRSCKLVVISIGVVVVNAGSGSGRGGHEVRGRLGRDRTKRVRVGLRSHAHWWKLKCDLEYEQNGSDSFCLSPKIVKNTRKKPKHVIPATKKVPRYLQVLEY
jgi:hypothetical protein